MIENVVLAPDANVSTNIEFRPLAPAGRRAAAAPDFSMTSGEITR